ncbi:MAG: hypothetical protein ACYSTN_10110 [Planctomycetota bacterium]
MDVKIKTALVSVSDKEGVVDFAKKLAEMGVKIISTGGTAKKLGEAGLDVIGIESVTGFPEMMNGRVKTLHPKIHGGLLGLRDKAEHTAADDSQGRLYAAGGDREYRYWRSEYAQVRSQEPQVRYGGDES